MQKIPGLDTKIIHGSQKFVYKKIINLAFAKRAGYFRDISFADLISLFPSLRPLLRDNEQREIKYNNKKWSLKHGRHSSILIAWKKTLKNTFEQTKEWDVARSLAKYY